MKIYKRPKDSPCEAVMAPCEAVMVLEDARSNYNIVDAIACDVFGKATGDTWPIPTKDLKEEIIEASNFVYITRDDNNVLRLYPGADFQEVLEDHLQLWEAMEDIICNSEWDIINPLDLQHDDGTYLYMTDEYRNLLTFGMIGDNYGTSWYCEDIYENPVDSIIDVISLIERDGVAKMTPIGATFNRGVPIPDGLDKWDRYEFVCDWLERESRL